MQVRGKFFLIIFFLINLSTFFVQDVWGAGKSPSQFAKSIVEDLKKLKTVDVNILIPYVKEWNKSKDLDEKNPKQRFVYFLVDKVENFLIDESKNQSNIAMKNKKIQTIRDFFESLKKNKVTMDSLKNWSISTNQLKPKNIIRNQILFGEWVDCLLNGIKSFGSPTDPNQFKTLRDSIIMGNATKAWIGRVAISDKFKREAKFLASLYKKSFLVDDAKTYLGEIKTIDRKALNSYQKKELGNDVVSVIEGVLKDPDISSDNLILFMSSVKDFAAKGIINVSVPALLEGLVNKGIEIAKDEKELMSFGDKVQGFTEDIEKTIVNINAQRESELKLIKDGIDKPQKIVDINQKYDRIVQLYQNIKLKTEGLEVSIVGKVVELKSLSEDHVAIIRKKFKKWGENKTLAPAISSALNTFRKNHAEQIIKNIAKDADGSEPKNLEDLADECKAMAEIKGLETSDTQAAKELLEKIFPAIFKNTDPEKWQDVLTRFKGVKSDSLNSFQEKLSKLEKDPLTMQLFKLSSRLVLLKEQVAKLGMGLKGVADKLAPLKERLDGLKGALAGADDGGDDDEEEDD